MLYRHQCLYLAVQNNNYDFGNTFWAVGRLKQQLSSLLSTVAYLHTYFNGHEKRGTAPYLLLSRTTWHITTQQLLSQIFCSYLHTLLTSFHTTTFYLFNSVNMDSGTPFAFQSFPEVAHELWDMSRKSIPIAWLREELVPRPDHSEAIGFGESIISGYFLQRNAKVSSLHEWGRQTLWKRSNY